MSLRAQCRRIARIIPPDHVPTIACPQIPCGWAPPEGNASGELPSTRPAGRRSLDRLFVDEASGPRVVALPRYFRTRRCREGEYNNHHRQSNHPGFDCAPPTAPEPTVLGWFIQEHRGYTPHDSHFWLIHLDLPLSLRANKIVDLCVQAGHEKVTGAPTDPVFAAGVLMRTKFPLTTCLSQ